MKELKPSGAAAMLVYSCLFLHFFSLKNVDKTDFAVVNFGYPVDTKRFSNGGPRVSQVQLKGLVTNYGR